VRHKACLVFLLLPVQAALMQVFTVTVFAEPAHMQHIPMFVFDELFLKGKTKSGRAAPTRAKQKRAPEKLAPS
jgi:hypothetical protein